MKFGDNHSGYIASNITSIDNSIEKLVASIDTLAREIPDDDNTLGMITIICGKINEKINKRKTFEDEMVKDYSLVRNDDYEKFENFRKRN